MIASLKQYHLFKDFILRIVENHILPLSCMICHVLNPLVGQVENNNYSIYLQGTITSRKYGRVNPLQPNIFSRYCATECSLLQHFQLPIIFKRAQWAQLSSESIILLKLAAQFLLNFYLRAGVGVGHY